MGEPYKSTSVFPHVEDYETAERVARKSPSQSAVRAGYGKNADSYRDTGRIEVMASNDLLNRKNFGLLPEPEGRFGSFGISAIINLTMFGLLILFTLAQVHRAQVKKYETTQLVFPVDQPKPYTPPVPKVRVTAPPPVLQPKLEQPRISVPRPTPVPEPPKEVAIRTPMPLPAIAPAPPKAVAPPPQPKVGMFASNTPTAVANNKTAPSTRTGGFGDPVGVTPNPNASRPATVAAVGAFGAAPGTSQGAGAARKGAVQGTAFGSGVANGVPGGTSHGTVASAGFSNGVIGGQPGGTGTGRVASTGFGTPVAGGGSPTVTKVQKPETTSIVVLSKPRPQYTTEARQLRIEGDVTLEVQFNASGTVQVLKVVSGLGHGLDEQARIAAEGIRFKPAMRDGQPVDQVSTIHITFQLA